MKKSFVNLASRSRAGLSYGGLARQFAAVRPRVPKQDVPLSTTRGQGLSSLFNQWQTSTTKDPDQPLIIQDVGVVERQYNRWTANLPSVRPYYAVKCSPDDVLISALADVGAGFDCATSHELQQVLDAGVSPDDIIFANPIKSVGDIKFAAKHGVRKMTFDNADEVVKIAEHFPGAQVVLRLLTDDSGSLMRFGSKFGAPQDHVEHLLSLCQLHGLEVLGVSFHIGSGCFDTSSHESAIALARRTFDTAEKMGLPPLKMVDIGGGFPGNPIPNTREDDTPAFEEFAVAIQRAFDTYFPVKEFPDLQRISEPGRYFATAWGTLFTTVCGKRDATPRSSSPNDNNLETEASKRFLYYINDGVYGSFNCNIFDHASPIPVPVGDFLASVQANASTTTTQSSTVPITIQQSLESPAALPQQQQQQHAFSSSATPETAVSTIFGPTCDSMDVIVQDHPIRELFVGEHLAFDRMGAYTLAAGSRFNGCKRPLVMYMRSTSSE